MRFGEFRDGVLRSASGTLESLLILERTDSTNALGRRLVERLFADFCDPVPAALVGFEQTAGRGRQGRTWTSTAGRGAYVSFVVPIAADDVEAALPTLPVLTAIGVCEAVGAYCSERARIKWPNDVLVGEHKIAGILIETVSNEDGDAAAIVGCGVNHGHDRDDLPVPQATSIRLESAEPPSLPELVGRLISSVMKQLQAIGDVETAMPRYSELSAHEQGDALRCRVGDREVEGRFVRFEPGGLLRLEVDGAQEVIASGEIVES